MDAELLTKKINNALEKDQGAKYKEILQKICNDSSLIFGENSKRSYIGGSDIGHPCLRSVYYSFRDFSYPRQREGRIIRLLARGHMEEMRIKALLELVGVDLISRDDQGKELLYKDASRHAGCKIDGLAKFNGIAIITEFKTLNNSDYSRIKKHGLQEGKHDHWDQCQWNMAISGYEMCLYIGVKKEKDDLYIELIEPCQETVSSLSRKAQHVIFANTPPPRIGSDTYYVCKDMCNHYEVCHRQQKPKKNCRTCSHSVPDHNGWHCRYDHRAFNDDIRENHDCHDYRTIDNL